MNDAAATRILDEVFALYEKFGHADYIGEPVSQLEHMSQAAELAAQAGYDDEVVLAAFFHDIGHICVMKDEGNDMQGLGIRNHEKVGADYLRAKGFPERLARLVESHVSAKRYLCRRYPAYYETLSEASRLTLMNQGGKMSEDEALQFEQAPDFEQMVLLRRWDEMAKEVGVPVLNVTQLRELARKVLISRGS